MPAAAATESTTAASATGSLLLLVDPVVLDTLLAAGHVATWTWQVPSAPSLAGLAFYNQAFAFDPPANAFGFTASHGGAGVLGL